ncbi:flagellar hook protein FlgE [Roseinatronobacter alkalisoli]|uniref:Flagellar hook protein FlgE n=1 Tax=Roseinatronobacter alkalisoli TaxID=3028235 RepID=A0ABT5T506_9RHOB|nr:flagellar hook-basal body complex protein [Roseinatronobacter sp. HJB301]MDD7970198.1 flagellar hook-basal body complex protein [Roseinatronobacter sp. HJB301]
MSISSSMNAGIAGLRAHSSRLGTISDNIANSATLGYRRSETTFHSMVVGSGIAGQGAYSAGGVRSTSMKQVDQGGSLMGTQNSTDLAITGRGFLPVTTELGARLNDGTAPMLLSPTGSFRLDNSGVMRDSAGNTLLGWPLDADGVMPVTPRDKASGLRPIRVDMNQQASVATSVVNLGINLPAAATLPDASGDPHAILIDYFNPVGLPGKLEVLFTPVTDPAGATNTWSLTLTEVDTGAALGTYTIQFNDMPGLGGTLQSVTRTSAEGGDYDPETGSFDIEIAGQQIDIFAGYYGQNEGMVQRGTNFSPTGVEQNGFGSSTIIGLTVDAAGNLDAIYDQGFRRTLYRIPIVDVPNPNGLTAKSNQAFQVSRDSGPFYLWDAGTGPVGEIASYALQESATDVGAELTTLIQTQRAYSSNAKVIQTVDEMLQETTNIKR